MGINEIALERILRLLIEEKAVAKLLNIIENEKIDDGGTVFSNSNNKKILMWQHTVIDHTMPWLN